MHSDKSQNKKIILHMKTLLLILSAILFFLQTGKACTIIVAGKKATVDGSVLNSHTDAGADCRIRVVAGQKFPKGSMAPVYYGIQRVDLPLDDNGEILGYIPQVEQT